MEYLFGQHPKARGMEAKMKKYNVFISLFMVFVIYCALSAWGKIGIIRDEYGITENGISFTFIEMIVTIVFPLIIILTNSVLFFQKKEVKSRIKYFVIIISILVSVAALLSLFKINDNLNKSILQTSQMQEVTLAGFSQMPFLHV